MMNEVSALFSGDKIYVNGQDKLENQLDLSPLSKLSSAIYIIENEFNGDIDGKFLDLINKMNAAIKYDANELAIISAHSDSFIRLDAISAVSSCELIVLFGDLMNSRVSQLSLPYQVMVEIGGIKILRTDKIELIEKDAKLKAQFWNALKVAIKA